MLQEEMNIHATESPEAVENSDVPEPPAKTPRPRYKPKNAVGTSLLISLAIHAVLLAIIVAVVVHYSGGDFTKSFFSKLDPPKIKDPEAALNADSGDSFYLPAPPMPLAGYGGFDALPPTESEIAAERAMHAVPPEFLTPPNIELDGLMDEPYLWGVNPSPGLSPDIAPFPIRHANPATDSSK